jgi:hypothetical protein
MNKLDTNTLFNIAKIMNIQDILSLCQTSKQMQNVCNSRLLWRHLLLRDYEVKLFNYQAEVFPVYNVEKSIYFKFLNEDFYDVVFEKKENSVEYTVEFGLINDIIYSIGTTDGEKLNYIKNTNTYKMFKNLFQKNDEEIQLYTYEDIYGYIDGIHPSGIVQTIVYNYNDRHIISQIINFLTNEGYILTD